MTYETLTSNEHSLLLEVIQNYPVLTFQNKGYEGIDRRKFNDKEKQADKFMNNLLSSKIVGFSKFQNFKLRNDGEIVIRFQYNYSADCQNEPGYRPYFIGVGYLTVNELTQ